MLYAVSVRVRVRVRVCVCVCVCVCGLMCLPNGTLGWSLICETGISLSYYLSYVLSHA